MNEMTEEEKNGRVFAALRRLAPGSKLVLLERYEPEPWAKLNECYGNCTEKVNSSGGAVVHGWLFAGQWEHAYVVATAHAVWRSPQGELIDITPRLPVPDPLPDEILPPLKVMGSGHWLFLPDPDACEQHSRALPLFGDRKLVRACRRWTRWAYQERQNPEEFMAKIRKLHRDSARTR